MKTVFHRRRLSPFICNVFFVFALILADAKRSSSQTKVESNRYQASREFIPSSPAASMFSIFGHTPVSHFTGAPQIEVPLHNAVYRDLSIELNLMYHSSMGNRPDAFPGPVGNGWLLNFGGAITRISKGVRTSDFPDPQTIPVGYNPTASSTWSSNTNMGTYIDAAKIFFAADGQYDEYAYNFCGLSGKFYTDHNGVKHFKTAQGESLKLETFAMVQRNVPIEFETQGDFGPYSITEPYRPSLDQKRYIFHFRITDSRGIKYSFGLVDEAIEFSRPGMAANQYDLREQNTIPTTWYLKSITSPSGYTVTLNYRRGKFYVTSETFCDGTIMTHSNMSGLSTPATAKAISSTIIHPSYLESISTPSGTINFYWSIAAQQLKYRHDPNPVFANADYPMHFVKYVDIRDALMENRFPDKLDSFRVFVNQQLKKVVQFNYTSDTSTRLKLLSIKIKGNSSTKNGYDLWQFQYNNTPLPDYLSFKSDKYGFYNGHNNYITSDDPNYYSGLFGNSTSFADYLNSREPDSNYSRAEILSRVFYPTGGYSEFEYENNDYGRKATFWPIGLTNNPSNATKITGGLRIRKISTFDAANHKASEKNYVYKRNFATGGQISSGVLSYDPIFQETFSGTVSAPANKSASASNYQGSLTYRRWSTDPIYPASYNKGTHVTYSEVAEVNLDGSYTVYKYNNYDNGFHDKPAENMVCDNSNVASFYREDDVNSMELERGNLQGELLYTNTNQLVKKTEYLYDTSTIRFNNNVRVLKAIPNPIFARGNFPSLRYVATLHYTYFPYLLQKRQVDYTNANDSLVNIEDYAYDIPNRLLKEKSIVLSNNRRKRVLYRYTDDMVALGQTAPYTAMSSKHIVSTLIETEERLDTALLTINSTPYASGLSPNSNIFTPELSKTQYRYSTPETRIVYHKYDPIGNLLYQSTDGISRTCYLWSYERLYPIAKIVNTSYDTVQAVLTANSIDSFAQLSSPTLLQVAAFINRLRNNPRMAKAMITSYAYDPAFGLTSETDVNGKTTYYEYDHLSRLKIIRDKDQNIIRAICYDYAGQVSDCSIERLHGNKQLYRANNINAICGPFSDPPVVLVPVTAYYQSQIPSIDTGEVVYYSDPQYQNKLATGYYKDHSIPPIGSTSYHYVVDGQILYTANCDGAQPFLTRYTSTQVSNMCSSALPAKSIFSWSQNPFTINAFWYVNQAMTMPAEDGYYAYDDKYYQIYSGRVASIEYCQPPSTKILKRDPYFQNVCEAQTFATHTVYYRGSFGIGTALYTNAAMTTALGAGHYSDGSSVITVLSSGSVMRYMSCYGAANLPPEQIPGPIF